MEEQNKGLTVQRVCPKCGEQIEIISDNVRYGIPIKVCPHCNEEYIDKNIKEIALQGAWKVDYLPINPWFLGLTAAGMFLGWCALDDLSMGKGGKVATFGPIVSVFLILIGIVACFMSAKEYPERLNTIKKERILSKKRVKDSTYVERLRKAGLKIKKEL